MSATREAVAAHARTKAPKLPGQVVLELQGGGALGAYQLGVYQAMHEAGIVPDWVVGTSIGAINAALIAGNAPEHRLDRLREYWKRMEIQTLPAWLGGGNALVNLMTFTRGLPAFFKPNPAALLGQHAAIGIEKASYYCTDALRRTLNDLVDWDYLHSGATRLTVGAVNARTGEMKYFDSQSDKLTVEHVMASGALPPAFAAVRIDGEPYWDGGIYSNTPTEIVLNDNPRRNSVIFSVQLWNSVGDEPCSLWQIQNRTKDIQFASRNTSHVAEQQKIHKLRHIIRELVKHVPAKDLARAEVAELASWGCGSTMHIVRLTSPRLSGEDHTKDIDFTAEGIRARWAFGHSHGLRAIELAPWTSAVDPRDGVVIHDIR